VEFAAALGRLRRCCGDLATVPTSRVFVIDPNVGILAPDCAVWSHLLGLSFGLSPSGLCTGFARR